MSVPWSYLNFTCGEFFISTWQSQTEALVLLYKVCINLWHILSHHRTEIDRWTEYSMKKFCLMTYLCTQPPHPGYAYTRCLPYHENNSQYSSRFQYMSCWSSALANQDHPPRRKHLTPRHLMTGSPAVDIWRPRPFCPISGRILYPMCCCGKLQRGLLTMLTRPPTGLYLMTRKMRKIVKRWYFRNAKGMKGIKYCQKGLQPVFCSFIVRSQTFWTPLVKEDDWCLCLNTLLSITLEWHELPMIKKSLQLLMCTKGYSFLASKPPWLSNNDNVEWFERYKTKELTGILKSGETVKG